MPLPTLIRPGGRSRLALAMAALCGLRECAALLRSRAQALWRTTPALRRR